MDEEISIIDSKTRNEKIKDFLIKNKKIFLIFLCSLVLILIIFFAYKAYKDNERLKISNSYNSSILDYKPSSKNSTLKKLIEIIKKKDPTYSPLSLFFIIDNDLILEKEKINNFFDILINQTSLEEEIKYLVIYKKALFNADTSNEKELLDMVMPLIKSDSIWKSHALYLMGEFFFSNNEKEKSKEFFNQLVELEVANQDLKKEARKRLNRDLGE